jgi:tetratricopeptide (TPR) repeat protein
MGRCIVICHVAFVLTVVLAGCPKKERKPVPAPSPLDDPFAASAAAGIPEPGQPIVIPPAASPTPSAAADAGGLPLIGTAGVDANGYPQQSIDPVALQKMLRERRFAELTSTIEGFQAAFERDYRHETWMHDALQAFPSDPALEELLNAWQQAAPTSFAPLAARGVYFASMGFDKRGTAYVSDTQQAQLDRMKELHARAITDLRAALKLRPQLVAAYGSLINMGRASRGSGVVPRLELAAALAQCPHCFHVRRIYLMGLQPRWGGSYDAMDAFSADAAKDTANPRLAQLRGYADDDRCDMARSKGNYDVAAEACAKALALGENADFLTTQADLQERREDWGGAAATLQRAIALRPNRADLYADRVYADCKGKRFDDVLRDAQRAVEIDAFAAKVIKARDRAVMCLLDDAHDRFREDAHAAAITAYENVLKLDPQNSEAQMWLDRARKRVGAPSSEALPPEVGVVQSFEKTKELDDRLAERGEYAAIATMWARYIEKNPNDANAFFERGGTYTHLAKGMEAFADFTTACRLGRKEACGIAEQVKRKMESH